MDGGSVDWLDGDLFVFDRLIVDIGGGGISVGILFLIGFGSWCCFGLF